MFVSIITVSLSLGRLKCHMKERESCKIYMHMGKRESSYESAVLEKGIRNRMTPRILHTHDSMADMISKLLFLSQ